MLKYVLKLAENYSHISIFITEIVKQSSKCKRRNPNFLIHNFEEKSYAKHGYLMFPNQQRNPSYGVPSVPEPRRRMYV